MKKTASLKARRFFFALETPALLKTKQVFLLLE
jgi:hypothetical protein